MRDNAIEAMENVPLPEGALYTPPQHIKDLNGYQSKLQAWLFWNSQSSEFKLKFPEPPKPKREPME